MSMKKLILDAVEARERYNNAEELAKMATDEQLKRKSELERAEWAISEKAQADFEAEDPENSRRLMNRTYVAKGKNGKTYAVRVWKESGRGTHVNVYTATEVED